jgi:hypothetical protein
MLSFLSQFCLILAFWIPMVSSSQPLLCCASISRHVKATQSYTLPKGLWSTAGKKQKELREMRFHAALASTLVEFQEAQSYFIIAIMIGIIIFQHSNASFEGSSAIAAVQFDNALINQLALSGVYPIVLAELCLRRYKLSSEYTYAVAFAAIVISAYVYTISAATGTLQVAEHFRGTNIIPQCGGHTDPRSYCNLALGTNLPTFIDQLTSKLVIALSVIVLFMIGLEKLAEALEESESWIRTTLIRYLKRTTLVGYLTKSVSHSRFKTTFKAGQYIFWVLLETIFLGLTLFSLSVFIMQAIPQVSPPLRKIDCNQHQLTIF